MKCYEFKQTRKVEQVVYPAGTIVPRTTINPGCAESLLRLGEIVECEVPEPVEPSKKTKPPAPPASK